MSTNKQNDTQEKTKPNGTPTSKIRQNDQANKQSEMVHEQQISSNRHVTIIF